MARTKLLRFKLINPTKTYMELKLFGNILISTSYLKIKLNDSFDFGMMKSHVDPVLEYLVVLV